MKDLVKTLMVFTVLRNNDHVFDRTKEMKLYSGCIDVCNQIDYLKLNRNSFENCSRRTIPVFKSRN